MVARQGNVRGVRRAESLAWKAKEKQPHEQLAEANVWPRLRGQQMRL